MEVRAPVARRRVTLAEQLAASSNLRDLLKLRDDDEGGGGGRLAAAGRRRTLLDVIHDPDDDGAPAVAPRVLTAAGAGGTPASASARRERVSLMALLERTEQQWTAASGELWKRMDGEREEEEEEKGGSVGELCCVCVARDKGAAFIPCGHTFCRACARELRAGRGRCPLCNAAIREVLNLF